MPLLALLFALGCPPGGAITVGDLDRVGPALVAAPAFDPIGGGPLDIRVEASGQGHLEVRVLDEAGDQVAFWARPVHGSAVLEVSWDGRLPEGDRASTGLYHLEAVVVGEEGERVIDEQAVALVRCGFEAAWLDGDGVTATRVPLFWHEAWSLEDPDLPISTLQGLETAAGGPQHFPAVPDELGTRPDQAAPAAFVWDSRPLLTLVPSAETVLGDPGLDLVDLSVAATGFARLDDAPLALGQAAVLQARDPLLEGPGVFEDVIELSCVHHDEQGTRFEVSNQALPVRIYALLDEPGFTESGARYHPWPAAVDGALRALEGTPPDPDAVRDRLVEWVYRELDLRYDTAWGASAYTTYVWGDWRQAHFRMSDFLERRFGNVVNCTDCAGIVGTYANMVGAQLEYVIILSNFQLNPIKAIGSDTFTPCPFDSGSCGFNYHAVNTRGAGARIWDATLAVDGGDDPGSLPSVELLVQDIEGADYLYRLVSSGSAGYHHESQGTIQ